VSTNTLATVKRQIQQAENPTPAVVIRVKAACVDNAIHHDYLAAEVVPKQLQIRSANPNIPMDNNCKQ
jgi:hypothetical protein